MESLPRLVVFSDDWGRHPSSSQHLVRELLPRWHVDWVNTIGTRRPSFTLADAGRAIEKARAWFTPRGTPEVLPEHLTVHSPIHWPGFSTRIERGINARLFDSRLRPLIERADAIVTTASITADLALRTRDANWTYYCVDDLAEWPGLDADALRAMELDMLPAMRSIVAVSPHLVERLAGLGRDAHLLTHGIELAHWAQVAKRPPRARQTRPVATFWGHADARLDVDVVLALAAACELRMVGPRSGLDARIQDERAIRWMDSVPYADLTSIALESDVLVMPYADRPVTRAMQPLKLKEYLATMLPVVATPLPANLAWSDALDLESDPKHFVARVLRRVFQPLPPEQARARERLAAEGWDQKALQFERWILRS
jgi:hypothetical protein